MWWLLGLLLVLLPGMGLAQGFVERGLLFRIESPGGKTNYLFGTIHSDDKRVLDLPGPVRLAFGSSRRLAIEVLPDVSLLLESMRVMIYDDGRNLEQVAGREIYLRSVEAMAGLGMPESAVRNLKPWTVATLLSVPPSKSGEFLDFYLYRLALERGMEVVGLETVQEQLAVFDGMREQDQLALLVDTLNNLRQLPMLHMQLLENYLQRDIGMLMELSNQTLQMGDQELSGRIQERVVDGRNRKMAERLEPLMKRGGLFAAVGALHLPGESGLLQLMRNKGFSVKIVY